MIQCIVGANPTRSPKKGNIMILIRYEDPQEVLNYGYFLSMLPDRVEPTAWIVNHYGYITEIEAARIKFPSPEIDAYQRELLQAFSGM